jgi:hypothetical protein
MGTPQPLKKQKQSLENQSAMQRELLNRDMAEVRRDWSQVKGLLEVIWSMFDGKR